VYRWVLTFTAEFIHFLTVQQLAQVVDVASLMEVHP
jgi:hypothetical protein